MVRSSILVLSRSRADVRRLAVGSGLEAAVVGPAVPVVEGREVHREVARHGAAPRETPLLFLVVPDAPWLLPAVRRLLAVDQQLQAFGVLAQGARLSRSL